MARPKGQQLLTDEQMEDLMDNLPRKWVEYKDSYRLEVDEEKAKEYE